MDGIVGGDSDNEQAQVLHATLPRSSHLLLLLPTPTTANDRTATYLGHDDRQIVEAPVEFCEAVKAAKEAKYTAKD